MPLMSDYYRHRDAEYDADVAYEPREMESALGDGCCGQCGEPVGMVRLKDGTDALGCLCRATFNELKAEIKRLRLVNANLEQTKDALLENLRQVREEVARIPSCFIAEERDTD